jgi:hypothetical protein
VKPCANCGRHALLVALHGDRGGPGVCIDCSGTLLAEVKSAQRRSQEWIDAMFNGFGRRYASPTELDAELLRDALALTHPDRHPPERADMATRVTAALSALKPLVKPRQPPPEPAPRNGKTTVAAANVREPVTPEHECRYLPLGLRCDECRAKRERQERERKDRENARRRRRRAICRGTMIGVCEVCGVGFQASRRDQVYCSPACRQRAYRNRKAASS